MRKKLVTVTATLAVAALAVCMVGCSAGSSTTNATNGLTSGRSSDSVTSLNQANETQEFKTVTFGTYEQDANTSNGAEAIEWYVLDEQDGKSLLISKYVLDAQPYNTVKETVSWADCSLRAWLNDDFLKKAFSSDEQKSIVATQLENYESPVPTQAGVVAQSEDFYGEETTDSVFLLSVSEARQYFISYKARIAQATQYACDQGLYLSNDESFDWYESEGANGIWWLRSAGYYNGYAAVVIGDGYIHGDGFRVDGETHDGYENHGQYASTLGGNFGVRPCVWVDSSALA